ncbi:MAG: MFS transporter [Dehalococcoidia bacterium]
MLEADKGVAAADQRPDHRRSTFAIAAAVMACNLADSFWSPFMPLFLITVGAKDGAEAVFWLAIATSVQGVMRLVAGPAWGILADRVGRKAMFLRALYLTGFGIAMIAAIENLWQLTLVYAMLGIFSGYNPASVALTSVSVPEDQIGRSLSVVTSAQYLGNTLGPMIGAVFLVFLDYRGTILLASLVPIISGTVMFILVPNDRPRVKQTAGSTPVAAVPLPPFRPTFQLGLAILLYFALFSISQLMRLLTPVAIDDITDASVKSTIGLTFTAGGLASALSLMFLAPRFYRAGQYQRVLVVSSGLAALTMVLLSLAASVPWYIVSYALFMLVHASMLPAANTLIAGNVSRERRGTAFGLAGSASAIAFMVGPFGAAVFAGTSIPAGFLVLSGVMFAVGALLFVALREPKMG